MKPFKNTPPNELVEKCRGNIFISISFAAIFIRAFHRSKVVFVKDGSPHVYLADFEINFNELWQYQKNHILLKDDILRVLYSTFSSHFLKKDNYLTFHNNCIPKLNYPRLKEIVLELFCDYLHEKRLVYAIQEEAIQFYQLAFSHEIQRALKIITREANARFVVGAGYKRNSFTDAINILNEVLKEKGVKVKPFNENSISTIQLVYLFFEIIGNQYLLSLKSGPYLNGFEKGASELQLQLRSPVTPEYVVVQLFGCSTGISGFDFILGSKLLLPFEGASIAITGPSGTGKSSISLLMAYEIALLGGLSVFISIETNADIPLRYISQYRSEDEDLVSFDVTCDSAFQKVKRDNPYGYMIFPEKLDTWSPETFCSDLEKLLGAIPKKGNRRFLVIDAINIISLFAKKESTALNNENVNVTNCIRDQRDFLERCINISKKYNFSILFIVETDKQFEMDENALFVTDLAIATDYGEVHGYYRFRVVKSRYQPAWTGISSIVFNKYNGPELFPGIACIANAFKERPSFIKEYHEPYWSKHFVGWNDHISVNTGWWCSPSVTALVGTQGSLKTFFLDTMNKGQKTTRSSRQKALVSIILGEESLPLRPQTRTSEFIRSSFQFGLRVETMHSNQSNDIEIYLIYNQRHVRPEELLWTFYSVLKETKKKGYDIAVCSINDLSHLDNNYPFIKSDGTFLPSFIDLCKFYNSEVVIVCKIDHLDRAQASLNNLESVADNIFIFHKTWFGGNSLYTFDIRKSVTAKHPEGYFQIQLSDKGECQILKKLRLVDKITDNSIHFIKTELILYAETFLQLEYFKRVNSTYSIQYNKSVDIKLLVPNELDGSLRTSHVLPDSTLRIMQTDSYLIDIESEKSKFYVNLNKFKEFRKIIDKFRDDTRANVNKKAFANNDKTEVYSVPYYLNPSVLVLPNSEPFFNYNENEHGWEWLITTAIQYRNKMKEKGEEYGNSVPRLFGCPRVSAENINTLFLEIFISFLKVDKNIIKKSPEYLNGILQDYKNIKTLFSENKTTVFKATMILCQLLIDTDWKYVDNKSNGYLANTDKTNEIIRQAQIPEEAIFYRSWYTMVRQLFSDNSSKKKQTDYIIKPLPGDISTRGDWCLTIPVGSASPEEGIEFIKDLCCVEAAKERVASGVGLPPHKYFYEEKTLSGYQLPGTGLTFKAIDHLTKCGIDRSLFLDYGMIGSNLAYYIIQFIFQWNQCGGNDLNKCLMPHEIENLNVEKFIKKMENFWPGFWT